MLEKIRFHASAGFCHRKLSLFWWMIVFKNFFQSLGGCFLDFGKKLQQIVKIVFLSVQRNIFCEKSFFRTKIFLQDFFRTWKGVVLWQWTFYRLSKMRFISPEELFARNSFSEKKIKCSITFFRIRETLFSSDLGENRAFGRKVSSRLPKLDSTFPKCFIKENFFLDEWMSWNFFSNFWRVFFSDSCKNYRKIVKLLFFICLEQLLYVKIFSWKTKASGNFSPKFSAVLYKFLTTNRNLAEKYQHSCQNLTLRFRGDLCGNTCSPEEKSNE